MLRRDTNAPRIVTYPHTHMDIDTDTQRHRHKDTDADTQMEQWQGSRKCKQYGSEGSWSQMMKIRKTHGHLWPN